jgi:hypothetical protein
MLCDRDSNPISRSFCNWRIAQAFSFGFPYLFQTHSFEVQVCCSFLWTEYSIPNKHAATCLHEPSALEKNRKYTLCICLCSSRSLVTSRFKTRSVGHRPAVVLCSFMCLGTCLGPFDAKLRRKNASSLLRSRVYA